MRVRFRELRVDYPDRENRSRRALGPLTFETERHEFLAIVGASGCGKTTLLRALAGILRPASGSLEILREPTDGPVLLVPQENNLFPWLTALENAVYGLRRAGVSSAACFARAMPLFQRLGLAGREHAWPRELSTGMKQRVAVIRAFLSRPGMLLMDEPFGALDAQTREQLQRQLQELWLDSPSGVVFVTHDVEEAILLGQRVLVLEGSPGGIGMSCQVPFPYPRDFETTLLPEFVDLKHRVHAALGLQRERARAG